MIILDASVAGALLLPDERGVLSDDAARRLLATPLLVPMHWHLEVANVVGMAVRRQRLTAAQAAATLADASGFDPIVDPATGDMAFKATSTLAGRHDLTVYDAAYLELAFRTAHPLATLDKRLGKAAEREGITLVDLGA